MPYKISKYIKTDPAIKYSPFTITIETDDISSLFIEFEELLNYMQSQLKKEEKKEEEKPAEEKPKERNPMTCPYAKRVWTSKYAPDSILIECQKGNDRLIVSVPKEIYESYKGKTLPECRVCRFWTEKD